MATGKKFSIIKVRAREILDSRGNPTVEADVVTEGGVLGRAAAPSGASTGIWEAVELRDGGKRYCGKGVSNAVRNVNSLISKKLAGMDVRDQKAVDEAMIALDGTENKGRLGANAIVAVSMAAAKAAADASGMPLYAHMSELFGNKKGKSTTTTYVMPVPCLNVLNGGKHAGGKLALQEFMIIPAGARKFSEGLMMGTEVYHALKEIVVKRYGATAKNVGDEGGFAPGMETAAEALDCLVDAIAGAGYSGKVMIGLDPAASSFYEENGKKYAVDGRKLSREEMVDFYAVLAKNYPIISIEDPFQEEDFDAFRMLREKIGNTVQIVGDDLFVTNIKRIQTGIDLGSASALLLKVNQIGSITESFAAAKLSFDSGMNVMVSHRSGETEDTTIADLAVGIGCGQLKTGAPARTERCAKYNRLLRIEEELGARAKYPGIDAFARNKKKTYNKK